MNYHDGIHEVDIQPITEQWRTARKQHRCATCPAPIEPGTRYLRIVEKIDGELVATNYHSKWCWETNN